MSLPCRIILSLTVGALVTYSVIVGFNLVEGLLTLGFVLSRYYRLLYRYVTVSDSQIAILTTNIIGLNWFDVLTFASFIKVGSSVIKYMPQVYLNWKRKCTLGFAIDMGTDLEI